MEPKKSTKAKKRHISPLADTAVPSKISSKKKDCTKVVQLPECNSKKVPRCLKKCKTSCQTACETGRQDECDPRCETRAIIV